ncbi:GNAT family N-acetyltransferase [Azospirillum melinis]|uniref:GNAT family N-acetyltransferase n=1 Tax=Azospirillum melinis TaxID=328839 RepID=A0ABX2KF86_9PROT|nr:GNAT family N-acetyltransferase [Azospirillum melinis]MBP2307602.1 GNAT superfamily N-acetyltransferase [Azospirillum melinis]NUB00056.1 GNAT family N-acetyltransferase [Azospirillum melinis]
MEDGVGDGVGDGALPGSLTVDAFDMRVADIADIDLERLHALSISVGWPHRAEDWQFVREVGHGFVALDEIDRVLASAMWFPHGDDFATIGMVMTSPRLQALGVGDWLMKRVLSASAGRTYRLNATRAALALYRSLGFIGHRTVFQCQGEARRSGHAAPAPAVRQLEAADLAAVTALDERAFGISRAGLMARLFEQSVGYGLDRDGALVAFALCRPFGRGHVVGPAVAGTDEDAIAVIQPHVDEHDGRFLRLDTHLDEGPFPLFVARSGLRIHDTVLSMSLGAPLTDPSTRAPDRPVTYALATQALG